MACKPRHLHWLGENVKVEYFELIEALLYKKQSRITTEFDMLRLQSNAIEQLL